MIECQICYKPTSDKNKFCDNCGATLNKSRKSQVQYTKPKTYDSDKVRYKEGSISVEEWIFIFILLAIPFVNIVLIFVWAFSDSVNETQKNYAKATLIMIPIGIILGLIFGALF